jgi:hypothetical protein
MFQVEFGEARGLLVLYQDTSPVSRVGASHLGIADIISGCVNSVPICQLLPSSRKFLGEQLIADSGVGEGRTKIHCKCTVCP